MALVQSLAYHGLDDRLPADVEIFGGALELFQHRGRKIHVDALDGLSHFAGIAEKARNILALVRHPSDGFGRDRLLLTSSVLHKVSAPRWLLSIRSPDGRILLRHLPEPQKLPSTGAGLNAKWQIAYPAG